MPRHEVLGVYAWDLATRMIPDKNRREGIRSRMEESIKLTIKSGTITHPDPVYYEFHRHDGTTAIAKQIEFIVKTSHGHMIGTLNQDVTPEKCADEKIKESGELLRDIIEKNPLSIQIVDGDGFTLQVNPAHTKLFGAVPPPDFSIFTDLVNKHPEFEECILRVKSGESVQLPDVQYNVHDIYPECPDVPVWVRAMIFPLKDKHGRPERFVFMHENITERKEAEERLSEINRAFLTFGPDPLVNIGILTGLAGRLLRGTCALYYRLEGGILRSLGMWNTPSDFTPCDRPEGHICTNIIRTGGSSPTIISNLLESTYADTDPNVRRYQFRTCVGIPVKIGESFLGALCIVYQDAYSPSPQDLEILEFIAKAIATEDERRTAGLALRESEAKHRILIEESSDPLFTFTPEGRYTYANPALADVFGKPVGEIIGKSIWDFFPQEMADKRFAALSQVFHTGEKNVVEGPVPTADGDRYYLTTITPVKDTAGKVISAICTSIDITERKVAEEALFESENKFASVFYGSPVALTLVSVTDGLFVDVNDTFVRVTGYSRDEVIGVTSEALGIFDNNDEREQLVSTLRGQKTVHDMEIRCRMKTGEIRPCLFSSGLILIGGKPHILSTIRDITDSKRAEEMIRSSLAEKEVLLREIHHRVKNNLTGIISLIDLQRGTLTDPAAISQITDLEARIRSMALVHESLYRTENLARVNVAGYTENLTRYLFPVYETTTVIRTSIEMGDITLPIETAIPCGLVMSEIVTNSLKYAFPPTFSCSEIRGEPCTIALTLQHEGSDYILRIADNGIGIPEGTDVSMSHSLGLYLIRFIVEHQLRGSLEISTLGGTAYSIRFPEPAIRERITHE